MTPTLQRLLLAAAVPVILLAGVTRATVPTAITYTPLNPVPPNVLATPPKPVVMLNLSRDHQLFYRAYNEFSDYDGDGRPDGGYLHTLRYAGYFDPAKCYVYSATNGRFEPSTVLAERTATCTGAWHGNFLNWATMTRIDVLRKVLYGGTRVVDTDRLTVLERASLPMDAHSFAKYYAGGTTPSQPAISGLTPFTGLAEITFCNTTLGDNSTVSHTNANPPLLRAARGNFALWNSHERRQCRWNEETLWGANGSPNGNVSSSTGIPAASNYPSRATEGLNTSGVTNADYVVRVETCRAGLVGTERCRTYPGAPAGASKPIGLLQEYGETNQAEFGLLTGSYSRNVSGGVLRKYASSFRDEVRWDVDGTFIAAARGIVHNLDRLRVYGFRYSDATYAADDNAARADGFCDYQTVGLVDNQCASWGNPIGEMFIETLRYLRGGLAPASAFGGNSDPKGEAMGLTTVTLTADGKWVDPFARGPAVEAEFGLGACRPINTVTFNASVVSYDGDGTGPFADLGASASLASYTNQVGAGEGINGSARFVGRLSGSTSAQDRNAACTAKQVDGLAAVDGLCPAAPAYRGTYSLAGAAYWANTNPIRAVPSTLTGAAAQRAFRVRSHAVALAPGVPRITVATADGLQAVIQPAYRLVLADGRAGSGTLVDFRVVEQTATSGRYIVLWEDSEQGGDYDQDFNGLLEWRLDGNRLTVTTRRIADSTGGGAQGFGYTISGTDRDGVHFHTGILGFTYSDPTNLPVVDPATGTRPASINASGGCEACTSANNAMATQATYTVTGRVGQALEDPLWYAAKWGGFRDAQGLASGTPATDRSTWDAIRNSDGAPGADGVPDTYSVVFNPEQLEASLRRVFDDAIGVSNAAPALASAQLVGGAFKYAASFDRGRNAGDVEAFQINSSGSFNATASWAAGAELAGVAADRREVISNDEATGIPFDWAEISKGVRKDYRSRLLGGTRLLTDAEGARLVGFIRGDRSGEGIGGVRTRPTRNILGPVVNASPWLQGPPSARFVNLRHPGYAAFAEARKDRRPLLWVAANDGMLHAFDARADLAVGTRPVLSYVPGALVPRLNEVTQAALGVRAFVDGSPFSADVDLAAGWSGSADWRTYVFGTLGRGGRGVFALDATDTSANAMAASRAASVFRWDFTADDDPDLGHVVADVSTEPGTGQPAPIVKLEDGRFALVFGNGIGSRDGRAVLFILYVRGPGATAWVEGTHYRKIVLDAGPGNGLSAPVILDLDNDGMADTVYAGDQRGHVWKLDLSGSDPSTWRSAFVSGSSPLPLYIATSSDGSTPLPITGAPQVAFPPFGGQMVVVATGRSIDPADFPRRGVTQRVFGVWDRPGFANGSRALPRGTATLQPRAVTRTATGEILVGNATPVDYLNTDPALARDGWWYDLPGSSEMVISNIGFRGGSVFFTSIRPPQTSASCTDAPLSTLYLIDPIAGVAPRSPLASVVENGVTVAAVGIAIEDQKVRDTLDGTSGSPSDPGVSPCVGASCTPVQACTGAGVGLRFVGRTADRIVCQSQTTARRQWREIPGLRTGG
jgi:type IV pilus assembly protein PilY1